MKMSLEEYNSENHGDDMEKQFFFNILEDPHYLTSIEELRNKRICAYVHEWLVLQDLGSGDCSLWNLTSKDTIQLPPLPKYDNLMCLLSAPPHDTQCLVLFQITPVDDTNYNENPDDDRVVNSPTLYFCKPGYNQEFHKQQLTEDDKFSTWIVFNGKFYGLTYQRTRLVLLDLDNDSGIVTVTPMVNEPAYDQCGYLDMTHSRGYLIHQSSSDHDAELLYVHVRYYGYAAEEIYEFQVYRFDFVKNVWLKVESIGDNAIFLFDSTGTTCSTRGTHLIKREFIYFTECDNCVDMFNLKRMEIVKSLPCPHASETESWFYLLCICFLQRN